MTALLQHLKVTLQLHFRNRMALFYGYLFPVIFLVAFWVLYRYDRIPLIRHLGELLTISVLGGACFGLPTSLVSERERGVWKRYRMTPLSLGSLVTSVMVARHLLILTAGLLQIVLAMALGMPAAAHWADLLVAFTFVSFAFMGLGLVIASLAPNVPAVQALGQCIFLPMLIIGGVAVPLTALPDWAQHVSAFFPGRYAVEAIQASANGAGLAGAGFALLALFLIGAAGCLAGARMFRWDTQQGWRTEGSKVWIGVALAAWIAVGLLAESRGRVAVPADADFEQQPVEPTAPVSTPEAPAPSPEPPADPTPVIASEPEPEASPKEAESAAEVAAPAAGPSSWQEITSAQIQAVRYFRVPPDEGVVAPIAPEGEEPQAEFADLVYDVEESLPAWAPARVADPVQRARNLLYVAAVPDALQLPTEAYMPAVVFDALIMEFPREDLLKILAWIALNPLGGEDSAVGRVGELGIAGSVYTDLARERAYYYAVKLLVRQIEQR